MAVRSAVLAVAAIVTIARAVKPSSAVGGGRLRARNRTDQVGLRLPDEDVLLSVIQEPSRQPLMATSLKVAADAEDKARAAAESGTAAAVVIVDLTSRSLHVEPMAAAADAGRVVVAWARYNNSVKQTGWAYLSVGVAEDTRISDDVKMYAAGYLEGLLSARQIRDFQHNANVLLMQDEEKHHALGNIRDLFAKEIAGIRDHAGMKGGVNLAADNAPADPWWRHARYALLQTWGVLDAYNQQADSVKGKRMSLVDMIVLSSDGETPELERAYDMEEVLLRQSQREDAAAPEGEVPAGKPGSAGVFLQASRRDRRRLRNGHQAVGGSEGQYPQPARHFRSVRPPRHLDDGVWRRIKESSGRCSALVRLAPGNRDLMVGHTTFSDYSEMNRVFKYYDFPIEGSAVRKMGFSSYPGVVGSTDDYYVMDSGLVVTETTVSMLSDEAYDKLDDSGSSLPDFMRIMLANRLAKSGQEWVDLMGRNAAGTYSSQWMVVDYNRFVPGKQLSSGALFVLEQVPGLSHVADETARLQATGYWASENRAWYKDVRDSIGATEAAEIHGALFSADQNPRAHIFAGTAPKVATLAHMRDEMQRNKWPHEVDGGEGNTPDHAIAARGDLDKANPNPNGGVDSKVTNSCLARRLQCDAISGPTHESQAPFRWRSPEGRELYPGVPHDGMPDYWNFDWLRMGPDGESPLDGDGCAGDMA